ncbi:MAG: glycosyltransferase family 4 protein, partial [candidate division Zixibacteria bacterium]|nr:glycosyltransferase family 4 protein [candidate division Zixibacteria bacterium]
GNVYNGRLSALYANCALFVLPSSVEGLPIVLIEAMKHKAPALASDIPENMEILDGDHHSRQLGLSFNNKDFDSLLRMIRFGLSHPQRLKRLAENACDYVNKEYNWQPIVKKTEQVYLQALDLL